MSKDQEIGIKQIESKLDTYRSFFDSTMEINQELFTNTTPTKAQKQFLQKLEEFDSFARLNRNPAATEESSSRATSLISSLDEIELQIRDEQQTRLSLDSSTRMSDLFVDEDSMIAPNASRIKKSLDHSDILPVKQDIIDHGGVDEIDESQIPYEESPLYYQTMSPEELHLVAEQMRHLDPLPAGQDPIDHDGIDRMDELQVAYEEPPFSYQTAEELHLAAEQMRREKDSARVNKDSSVLFSILKALQKRPDCPEFLTRDFDQENYKGEYFQIKIPEGGDDHSQEKVIRVVRRKDGGFAMLTNNQQGQITEITSAETSRKIFTHISSLLYQSMPTKRVVAGVSVLKIANNFFIDETGKVASFNDNLDTLCSLSNSDIKTDDLMIVEDSSLDISNLYEMLIEGPFVKSSRVISSSDGKEIVCATADEINGNYALENKEGVIRILKRVEGSDSDYQLASSASEIIDFRQKMYTEIKDAVIFNAISSAKKGNWGLLKKAAADDRISKQDIIDHIEKYILSEKRHPFDIDFISKIAGNVKALSFNISKMMVKHRTYFLDQIIRESVSEKFDSYSFIIKMLSRSPSFLDVDDQSGKKHLHNESLEKAFGFITDLLTNIRDFDFDGQAIYNEEDFYSSYSHTLNRYANNLLNLEGGQLETNVAVITDSFLRIIDSCRVSSVAASSNSYLFLNLVTKALSSFSHKPSLSLIIHGSMIDALSDSRLDRASPEFKAIIIKICASLLKNAQFSPDIVKIFRRLSIACAENIDLKNLIDISLSQIAARNQSHKDKTRYYKKLTNKKRLDSITQLDLFPKEVLIAPGMSSYQVLQYRPQLLSYDEVHTITSSTRRQLVDFSVDLTPSINKPKILKSLREIEAKYQSSKPDLINLSQTFVDYDRCFTKTIIQDESGQQLFKIGDSIHDFIAAPINYYFKEEQETRDYLLDQIKELDVAAQSHGHNPLSFTDQETLQKLKPRLRDAIRNVAMFVDKHYPMHPYLVFLKGFNQSAEGEMLGDTQAFLEQRYGEKYLCNSQQETITVKLSRAEVTYQSNCKIAITKQDFAPTAPLATMEATGSISVNYRQNGEITNNSFLHSFENIDLDLKVVDEVENFIAQNANCHQLDQILNDLITDPSSANALSSLIQDPRSEYKKVISSDGIEKIFIPRHGDQGFLVTVVRNGDRTISNVILDNGLFKYNPKKYNKEEKDTDYDYSAKDHNFEQVTESLNPASYKELAMTVNKVKQLGQTINNISRPLRDAFCQLSSTKFNKKSSIGDVKKTSKYKYQYRKIGKLDSGKSIYLDENGRLLVNSSSTSTKLEPICNPPIHAIEKMPVDEVSANFDLTLKAQNFDLRSKTFSRFPQTFSVQVRKVGNYQDYKHQNYDIYQDRQGRYFKSMPNSSRIQEVLDLNNTAQASQVLNIITAFKERAHINEIFDLQQPNPLVTDSKEVTIDKIQYLKTSSNDKSRTPVREIRLQANTKSKEKSFHIDRFGEIYTKNTKGKLQKFDLQSLDQQSRSAVIRAIDLSYDNLHLTNIYQLLEKNNSAQKQPVDVKPYKCDTAHVFVKNGVRYALFKDDDSQDHHLMRLDYPKSVKTSKTGIITNPDQIQLITSQIHVKAIYDDLKKGTYLVNSAENLRISESQKGDITTKSFSLSNIDRNIIKDSDKDLHLAIDSNYRILFKKPEEKQFHIADFRQAKKLKPHFEKCSKVSRVLLEKWKEYYFDNITKPKEPLTPEMIAAYKEKIAVKQLHQTSKKEISAPNKMPSPHISTISVEHLHVHENTDDHLL